MSSLRRRSSLLGSGDEILASLNDSEGEGGLTPPPAKRPRRGPGGSSSDQGEPSSLQTASVSASHREVTDSALVLRAGESSSSGGQRAEEGSLSSYSAMQSNGVIHENGTSSSDFAVNGLVSLGKSNGCEESVLCEGREEGVSGPGGGGGTRRVGSTPVRKRKQRQLSQKDTDIVRLIGQHLREMGFK